jgi:prepilin-type N-terminal cleavage/methylation domain-containing protein
MTLRIRKPGFTIVELLVSVVIIAILTTVTTLSFLTAQRRARDNASKIQVQTIANAVETYYATNKTFPGLIDQNRPVVLSNADINTLQTSYSRCVNVDTSDTLDTNYSNPVYYYYSPFSDPSAGCQSKAPYPAATSAIYDPNSFLPYPNWIPGLGEFLSPVPVTKNYKASDGSSNPTLAYSDILLQASLGSTLVYRHLYQGYAVYTKLETNLGDVDSVAYNTDLNATQPFVPLNVHKVTGQFIYMVRK